VLGSECRSGGVTSDLQARVFRRGALAVQADDPQALTGRIPDLLAHLADMLGAFGETLEANAIVICGSTVPLPLIEPDETEFGYELSPIGALSVRFAR
jgi:2-keto-4-pentenoate hydratase